jgi:hypothetical protein
MTDEAVTLANLLQVIQARLLAEVRACTPHLERGRKCCDGVERPLVSKLLLAKILYLISHHCHVQVIVEMIQITVTAQVPSLTVSVPSLCAKDGEPGGQ